MTKFRSWISSIQTFTYFENGVYSCPKVKFDEWHKVPFDWDNAEQFRGICDKKGIELFDGDIFEWVNDNDELNRGEVVFENGSCYGVSMLGDKRMIGNTYNRNWNVYIEKIGNIHESPELLKETT